MTITQLIANLATLLDEHPELSSMPVNIQMGDRIEYVGSTWAVMDEEELYATEITIRSLRDWEYES